MNIELHAPQIIWLCLWTFTLGLEITKHGKPKEGKVNVWTTAISFPIAFALLYWGGFFK